MSTRRSLATSAVLATFTGGTLLHLTRRLRRPTGAPPTDELINTVADVVARATEGEPDAIRRLLDEASFSRLLDSAQWGQLGILEEARDHAFYQSVNSRLVRLNTERLMARAEGTLADHLETALALLEAWTEFGLIDTLQSRAELKITPPLLASCTNTLLRRYVEQQAKLAFDTRDPSVLRELFVTGRKRFEALAGVKLPNPAPWYDVVADCIEQPTLDDFGLEFDSLNLQAARRLAGTARGCGEVWAAKLVLACLIADCFSEEDIGGPAIIVELYTVAACGQPTIQRRRRRRPAWRS